MEHADLATEARVLGLLKIKQNINYKKFNYRENLKRSKRKAIKCDIHYCATGIVYNMNNELKRDSGERLRVSFDVVGDLDADRVDARRHDAHSLKQTFGRVHGEQSIFDNAIVCAIGCIALTFIIRINITLFLNNYLKFENPS